MISLVLFDIDGTLIRTGGAGSRAFARTFASEFRIPDATRGVSFAGRTDPSLVRECFRLHGIPEAPENFGRFFESYVFWLDHLLTESPGEHCPGVVEAIAVLGALSRPPLCGLLTGNVRLGAEIKLRHHHLWDHFELGAFGDDHEDRNQLGAVAQRRASGRLRRPISSNEILVIGDTPRDIECAQAIGAWVLAVATGEYSERELADHRPTWVAPNLGGVDLRALCD